MSGASPQKDKFQESRQSGSGSGENIDKPNEDMVAIDYEALSPDEVEDVHYRVYKRRWVGLVALFLLNVAAGMNWLWFCPISVSASETFKMSLTQINWLNNSVNLIYLPVSLMVPPLCTRYGIRNPCLGAAFLMALGSWIRYAGTAKSLSPHSTYVLLFIGQIMTGIAQPWFQVLGPRYSELWFDLGGRTTGTALIAISNPVGSALGELLSPLISDVRFSVLVVAIITTALAATSLLIQSKPPTPPTFAGSQISPSLMEVVRAWMGRAKLGELEMNRRQRIDLAIVTVVFGTLVGAANAFFILVDQIFNPYGYSNDASGNMGGVLIVSGIIAAVVTAPLFDRVFTKHLGLVAKLLVPVLAIAWLSLIWDVRPHNYGGLYPIFLIIGVGSFVLLPVALELGCEVTTSADSSSAVLWCFANLLSVIFVEVMDALREGDDGRPPRNMKRGLIFLGATAVVCCIPIFGLQARQSRRELDVQKAGTAQTQPSVVGEDVAS